MLQRNSSTRLSPEERATATLLRYAPWLTFALLALPAPLYFLFRYFTLTEGSGEYMLFALTSLAVGSLIGLLAVFAFSLYRWHWQKNLRDRLATDGVTVAELSWFTSELTTNERRALRQIEAHHPLLADAYRETLAARLTATRVAMTAKREAVAVERRLKNAAQFSTTERAALETELRADLQRLARIGDEATERRTQAEARLQMIEAEADRAAGEEETRVALERLQLAHTQAPLALVEAQRERAAREEVEGEMRDRER